jgi:hypothetical protein
VKALKPLIVTAILTLTATSSNASDAEEKTVIGNRLAQQGFYQEAVFFYNKALSVNPNYPPALSGRRNAISHIHHRSTHITPSTTKKPAHRKHRRSHIKHKISHFKHKRHYLKHKAAHPRFKHSYLGHKHHRLRHKHSHLGRKLSHFKHSHPHLKLKHSYHRHGHLHVKHRSLRAKPRYLHSKHTPSTFKHGALLKHESARSLPVKPPTNAKIVPHRVAPIVLPHVPTVTSSSPPAQGSVPQVSVTPTPSSKVPAAVQPSTSIPSSNGRAAVKPSTPVPSAPVTKRAHAISPTQPQEEANNSPPAWLIILTLATFGLFVAVIALWLRPPKPVSFEFTNRLPEREKVHK